MTPFHVGMKVSQITVEYFEPRPMLRYDASDWYTERGNIYTVRTIIGNWLDTGCLVLQFEEQPCSDDVYFHENYRPVVEPDISVFEKMLAPAPKKRVRTDA